MEALQTEMRIAILEMKENEIKRMSHNPIRMLQDIICSRRLSYWQDDRGSIPGRGNDENFFFATPSVLVSIQPPTQRERGGGGDGGKAAESDHSPQ